MRKMETFSINVMNTDVYVEISNIKKNNWREEIKAWLLYVDREWSRFHNDNELSMLNQLPQGESIQLSDPFYDVLYRADEYRKKTMGLFSPYLKIQMEANGYIKSFPFSDVPRTASANFHENMMRETKPFLFLDHNIILKNTNQKIDIGGFAKGYAIECAAQWLRSTGGAKYGIVDGGGDITTWSDGVKAWKIGIANPFKNGTEIGLIRIKNGAIATSNRLYRSWRYGDEIKHHLLNGKTGTPIRTDVVQATVMTNHLLDGEVLAKMCFLLSEKKRKHWFKEHYPHCRYFLVSESDRKKIEKEEFVDGDF